MSVQSVLNRRAGHGQAVLTGGSGQRTHVVDRLDVAVDGVLEAQQRGDRMVLVFGVYAAIILAFFAVRAIPSVDIRSMTSTVAFGPLTLVRPAVVVCGIGWGLAIGPQPSIIAAGILICVLMAPFRVWLNRWFDAKQWVAGTSEPSAAP